MGLLPIPFSSHLFPTAADLRWTAVAYRGEKKRGEEANTPPLLWIFKISTHSGNLLTSMSLKWVFARGFGCWQVLLKLLFADVKAFLTLINMQHVLLMDPQGQSLNTYTYLIDVRVIDGHCSLLLLRSESLLPISSFHLPTIHHSSFLAAVIERENVHQRSPGRYRLCPLPPLLPHSESDVTTSFLNFKRFQNSFVFLQFSCLCSLPAHCLTLALLGAHLL